MSRSTRWKRSNIRFAGSEYRNRRHQHPRSASERSKPVRRSQLICTNLHTHAEDCTYLAVLNPEAGRVFGETIVLSEGEFVVFEGFASLANQLHGIGSVHVEVSDLGLPDIYATIAKAADCPPLSRSRCPPCLPDGKCAVRTITAGASTIRKQATFPDEGVAGKPASVTV